MENKTYWQKRAEQRVLDSEKMVLDFEQRMKDAFLEAVSNIDADIAKMYVKYAKDNDMSYATALKYLTDNERKDFQRDVNYYIEKASDAEYRNLHRQELQSLSVRARVRRLEAMQANLMIESEQIYNRLKTDSGKLFDDVYEESYYRTAYDTQVAFNTALSFNKPNSTTVKKLLEYPWNGQSYSANLWDLEKGFTDSLNKTLTVGLIQGKSAQEMSRMLRDEAVGKGFDKGKVGGQMQRCQRLVRTESAYILNQATKDMYEEFGVEEYEFLGTLDSKTCEHCGGLDGKHYPVGKEKIGVNYPPLHPRCRCTTVPYFDDLDEYSDSKSMTYEEWREGLSEDEKGKMALTKKMDKNRNIDKTQYEKLKNILGKQAPKSLDEFRNLKYNDVEGWNEIKTFLRSKNYLQEQLSYVYNGERLFIPRHTVFDKTKVIAGANCEAPIKVIERLIGKYGGTADSWQKKVARIASEKYIYDVHWYELDSVQYETKMKSRSERRGKSK